MTLDWTRADTWGELWEQIAAHPGRAVYLREAPELAHPLVLPCVVGPEPVLIVALPQGAVAERVMRAMAARSIPVRGYIGGRGGES